MAAARRTTIRHEETRPKVRSSVLISRDTLHFLRHAYLHEIQSLRHWIHLHPPETLTDPKEKLILFQRLRLRIARLVATGNDCGRPFTRVWGRQPEIIQERLIALLGEKTYRQLTQTRKAGRV